MKKEQILEYRSHLRQQRLAINRKIHAIDTLLDETVKVVIKRYTTSSTDQGILDALTELGECTVSDIVLDVVAETGFMSTFNMEETERIVKKALKKLVKTGEVQLKNKLYSIKQ